MKNKLVKKNLPLFTVISIAGVISLGLLVYVILLMVELSDYNDRTSMARSKILKLLKQNPRPGRENELRIQHDVEVYKVAAEGLRKQFKSPLQPALDEFFAKLQPPLMSALSEEERELYKEPGTGVEADPDNNVKAVPLRIRKFNQNDFCQFFRSKFEKYCEDNGKNDVERGLMATLNEFMASNLRYFPKGNWIEAVSAFAKAAQPLTCEPLNESNRVAVLLSSLGFPRRVSDDQMMMQRHVDEIIEAIGRSASENKLVFGPDALKFIGGMSGDKGGSTMTLALKDYPMALFHWDVFGDIVNRLGKAKVTMLNSVTLRTTAEDSENGVRSGGINLEGSFESIGNYRIFHYTIAFSGTMEAIRNALHVFDQANKDNRTYVVRSLCLYAKENGAAVVMEQNSANRDQQEMAQPEPERQVRRIRRVRRGRGGYRAAAEEVREEKRDDDVQAQIAAREAALPPHQRSDYGMIRIGGDNECIAYLDVDYVVLVQNQ